MYPLAEVHNTEGLKWEEELLFTVLFTSKSEINAFEILSMVMIASYEVAPIVMTSL